MCSILLIANVILLYTKYCLFWICLQLGFVFPQDEICTTISEHGGIDAVLICIDDSSEQGNKTVAQACCSLLSRVKSFYSYTVTDSFL